MSSTSVNNSQCATQAEQHSAAAPNGFSTELPPSNGERSGSFGGLGLWLRTKQQQLVPADSLRARFACGTLWSVAGAGTLRGAVLAASVVCARLLGKAGFGQLGMVQSTAGMFGIFAGLGLGLTTTKYVAQLRQSDPGRAGRILALSSLVALISGGVMAVLLAVSASFLARSTLRAPELGLPLAIGSGLVLFGALNGAQNGALAGFEAFKSIAQVNLCAGLCSLPLIMFGVKYGGVQGAVCGFVASLAINWILAHRALRQECARAGVRYDFLRCREEWRVLHSFSLPAFLASIVVGPAWWACNTLLVNQPNGYSEMGLYSAADKWRLLILFVPTSMFGMVVPMLSNLYGAGDLVGYRKVFRANLFLNLGLVLASAVVIAGVAAPIMAIYGTAFRPGWPLLLILSLAAVPEALNGLLSQPLIVSDRMWWRFAFDLLLAISLIALSWFLVPHWKGTGLAVSYILAFIIVSFGLFLFTRYRLRPIFRRTI
jgi:O-antigen/teichoic acid export membrane protein